MTLHRKTPQKGAKNRYPHFPFVETPRGYGWDAHIAGPCHWFDCHDIGRSKPCLHCITNGELHCDRNHDIDEPVEIGYQPLWAASNGKPCMVIVYEYARPQIDALKLHRLVTVSRGKMKGETVAINYKGLNSPLYQTTRTDFMRPVDLTETLLRIWKIPELVAWVRSKQGHNPPPTTPPAKPWKEEKPASETDLRTMVARKLIEQAGGEQPKELAAGAVDESLRRLAQREAKHRKTGHLDKPAE